MPPFARKIVAFLVLPLVALLQAGAWYGARSVQGMMIMDRGYDWEVVGQSSQLNLLSVAGAIVVGGLLSIAVGPAATAAVGLLITAIGLAITPFLPGPTLFVGILVSGIGHGLTRAPMIAAAARPFGRGYEGARNALILLFYVGLNAAALVTPVVGGVAAERFGQLGMIAMHEAAAGAMLLAAALMALVAGVDLASDPETPPASSDVVDVRAIGLALGVAAVSMPAWAAWNIGMSPHADIVWNAFGYEYARWIAAINPVTICATGLALALAFGATQVVKLPVPTLGLVGIGLLLIAAGVASAAVPSLLANSTALIVVTSIAMAIGEVLLIALLASRLTGDLHWRLAALPVSLVFAFGYVASMLASFVGWSGPGVASSLIAGVCAAICGLTGVLFVIGALPMQRYAFDPPVEPSGEGDAG